MKNMKQLISFIGICVFFIGSGSVYAQDWPQWMGANRDGKVTGFTAPKVWPKELRQVWKTPVGLGDASPSLAGNKLIRFCPAR